MQTFKRFAKAQLSQNMKFQRGGVLVECFDMQFAYPFAALTTLVVTISLFPHLAVIKILSPKKMGFQRDTVPLAGSRDSVPCGGWGNAPTNNESFYVIFLKTKRGNCMKIKISKRLFMIMLCICFLLAVGFSALAADIAWSSDYQPGNRITVYFHNSNFSKPYIYCYTNGYEVKSWPGEQMTLESNGWYSYTIKDLSQVRVIFSDNGSHQNPGEGESGFLVSGDKWYCNGNWYDQQPQNTIVHYYNNQNWNSVNIYYYQNGLTAPNWPGTAMQYEADGWYKYEIVGFSSPKVVFSNSGNNQIPEQNQEGFSVSGEMWYKNGKWFNSNPTQYRQIKVHYYNKDNWDNVKLYYYDTETDNTDWPGVSMTAEGDGWYVYEIKCITDPKIIFSNNGNSQIPEQEETGFTVSSEMWYRNGTWYNTKPSTQHRQIKVHYYNCNNWNNVKLYYYDTGTDNYSWPGVSMASEGNGWYVYEIDCIDDPKVIFSNNGMDQIPLQDGFTVSSEKWYRNGTWYESKPSDITIYFSKPAGWNTPNIYYYQTENGTDPSWPGVSMQMTEDGWYKYTITKYSSAKVLFNDGTHQLPAAGKSGYDVSGVMWYKDGIWYKYNPDNIDTNTTVGDLNGDGIIDENDYKLLEDYLKNNGSGLTDEQKRLADVNGDGVVDDNDMKLLNDYINGDIEDFPVNNHLTNRDISYEYDKLGRVTRAIYDENNYIEYVYDSNGNITDVRVHGDVER